jgi:hypothetical protein
MNDSVYLDLSGKFASLVIKEKNSEDEQIKFAYKRATGKIIQPEQLEILKSLYVRSKEQYSKNLNLTNSFITIEKNKRPEYAAMAIVCNAILNLDEVIVKT